MLKNAKPTRSSPAGKPGLFLTNDRGSLFRCRAGRRGFLLRREKFAVSVESLEGPIFGGSFAYLAGIADYYYLQMV